MATDELKSMPKGHFILMEIGKNPMKTILKLFVHWKIKQDKNYEVEMRNQREVDYADMHEIESILKEKFGVNEIINSKVDVKKIVRESDVKFE